MESRRVQQIDAARGTAMLFVFVSHFGFVYFQRNGASLLDDLFMWVGMIATPTFMILSGVILGYLHQVSRGKFDRIRVRMRDRGLFFLVVGHFVISLAHIPRSHNKWSAFAYLFITDTIGLCIVTGPFLVEACKRRIRILLGIFLFFASWICSSLWNPGTRFGEVLKAGLVGSIYSDAGHFHIYSFPFLPWLGVYLVFTCLGEELGKQKLDPDDDKPLLLLKSVSLSMVGSAVLLVALKQSLQWYGVLPWPASPVWSLLYPFQKLPPGLAYFLFYGGVGLLILYVLHIVPDRGPYRKYLECSSLLGRASFFAFVAQYYVYYVAIYCANITYSLMWPLYFLLSVSAIFYLARIWDRNGLNRFLTLGLVPPSGKTPVPGLPGHPEPGG